MSGVGLYDGFTHYLAPSEADSVAALRGAVVVLDTNVLLNLYKYNDETRAEYLGALAHVGDRLWIPHQVMLEFWRSRRSVLVTIRQNYAGITKSLESTKRQAHESIARWERASATSCDDIAAELDRNFGELGRTIRQHSSTLADPARPTSEDEVLGQLESVLASRVEAAPDPGIRAQWLEEGNRRVARQIPPGYLDAPKEGRDAPDGAAGDFLVWRAAVAEAVRRKQDLLIITGDTKEDWWVQQDGRPIAPRPELAEEFRTDSGGRSLFLLQPQRFLELSAEGLGAVVSEATISNVDRIAQQDEDPEAGGDKPWTAQGVHEMLDRLDARGDWQAEVIRHATARGWVRRKTIFRLAHNRNPETGSLNGMTRPVTRIQQDLVAEGTIAPATEAMFTLKYEGGTLARVYIPNSVMEILQAERALLHSSGAAESDAREDEGDGSGSNAADIGAEVPAPVKAD